jgi:hypothetical protein
MFQDSMGIVQNEDLKMTKSWQSVLGFNQKVGQGMHFKAEVYYQHLYHVPVIPDIPEQSILNMGDDFYNDWDYVFVNKGKGRNYGIELTLEKFFTNNYYFLITTSLFDSWYTPFDDIERRTRFAGNYAFNALFGYEWKLGANRLLSVNTKASYVGGKRFVPTKFNSIGVVEIEYEWDKAYKEKLDDYFRLDLNVNMKTNYRRWSIEWFVEIMNLTNHENIWDKYFDTTRGKEEIIYQYGLMPGGGVRIYF